MTFHIDHEIQYNKPSKIRKVFIMTRKLGTKIVPRPPTPKEFGASVRQYLLPKEMRSGNSGPASLNVVKSLARYGNTTFNPIAPAQIALTALSGNYWYITFPVCLSTSVDSLYSGDDNVMVNIQRAIFRAHWFSSDQYRKLIVPFLIQSPSGVTPSAGQDSSVDVLAAIDTRVSGQHQVTLLGTIEFGRPQITQSDSGSTVNLVTSAIIDITKPTNAYSQRKNRSLMKSDEIDQVSLGIAYRLVDNSSCAVWIGNAGVDWAYTVTNRTSHRKQ